MSSLRRPIAFWAAIAHLLMSTLLVYPNAALAQAPDGEPPGIEFERIDEGVRGETQVFSAIVTDEVGIDRVSLHYRLGDTDPYTTVPMQPLVGTDIFTASVETAGTDESVLQYYIEARDGAGNRSIQGFAFDPIERALVDESQTLAAAPVPVEAPEAESMSTGRKVLYGVLGVLAVGALAAAAGGGDSDGDNPRGDDPNNAPLDIIVDPL